MERTLYLGGAERLRRSFHHAARVLALFALVGCAVAHAQPAAQAAVSQWSETNGIRVGPGRLHPYFAFETTYDSAAIYEPTVVNDPSSPYVLDPEIIMHFRPGFRLDVPGNDVTFGLNAFYDYVWFTGILTAGSQAASLSEAGADLHTEINQQGAVEVDIGDSFSRNARPADVGLGTAVISLYNQLRLRTPIHPGGRAFEVIPTAGTPSSSSATTAAFLPAPAPVLRRPAATTRAARTTRTTPAAWTSSGSSSPRPRWCSSRTTRDGPTSLRRDSTRRDRCSAWWPGSRAW